MLPRWQAMQDKYEAQIRRVKEIVPEERLLVWNIKDGWEPLCEFLGKPVPDEPIPVTKFSIQVELNRFLSTTTKPETNFLKNTFLKATLAKRWSPS